MKIVIGIIAAIALFFAAPRLFEPASLDSILLWLPIILVVALGQMLVITSGGIDVSVGSIIGCSAMTLGVFLKSNPDVSILTMLGLASGVGLLLGFINGALIAYAKLPPLIVTIGTLATFRGLAFLVSKSQTITGSMLPDSLGKLANNGLHLGKVTVSWLALFALAIAIVMGLWLRFSHAGRAIYAIGSQPEAATRRGLSVSKTQLLVYSICGLLAGAGGMIYASRFGLVHPGTAGRGLELTVIAAVAIAGTKLTGGTGSVVKVALSALLLSVITISLSVFGVNADYQNLLYGLVLLVAVCSDGYIRGRKSVA